MTGRAENTDFAEKPQIFADSPPLLEFKLLEGAGNRRKPQLSAENRRSSESQKTAGNRWGSVALGLMTSPYARPTLAGCFSPWAMARLLRLAGLIASTPAASASTQAFGSCRACSGDTTNTLLCLCASVTQEITTAAKMVVQKCL